MTSAIIRFVSTLPDAIMAAITSKDLRHEIGEVKISAKVSPTKKDEKTSYDALFPLTAQGMAVLCGGKLEAQTPRPTEGKDERSKEQRRKGAADYMGYGYDLERRAAVRGDLISGLEGPEKRDNAAAKALVASGAFESAEEALDFVTTRREAREAKAAENTAAAENAAEDSGENDNGEDTAT